MKTPRRPTKDALLTRFEGQTGIKRGTVLPVKERQATSVALWLTQTEPRQSKDVSAYKNLNNSEGGVTRETSNAQGDGQQNLWSLIGMKPRSFLLGLYVISVHI